MSHNSFTNFVFPAPPHAFQWKLTLDTALHASRQPLTGHQGQQPPHHLCPTPQAAKNLTQYRLQAETEHSRLRHLNTLWATSPEKAAAFYWAAPQTRFTWGTPHTWGWIPGSPLKWGDTARWVVSSGQQWWAVCVPHNSLCDIWCVLHLEKAMFLWKGRGRGLQLKKSQLPE